MGDSINFAEMMFKFDPFLTYRIKSKKTTLFRCGAKEMKNRLVDEEEMKEIVMNISKNKIKTILGCLQNILKVNVSGLRNQREIKKEIETKLEFKKEKVVPTRKLPVIKSKLFSFSTKQIEYLKTKKKQLDFRDIIFEKYMMETLKKKDNLKDVAFVDLLKFDSEFAYSKKKIRYDESYRLPKKPAKIFFSRLNVNPRSSSNKARVLLFV